MDDDINALYTDLEHELKPLLPYCKFIYLENELKVVSLKDDVRTKDICLLMNCKQKELIKLFDWFNNNLVMIDNIKEVLTK